MCNEFLESDSACHFDHYVGVVVSRVYLGCATNLFLDKIVAAGGLAWRSQFVDDVFKPIDFAAVTIAVLRAHARRERKILSETGNIVKTITLHI